MFGGYKYCGSANISLLPVSRGPIIKRSRDFEGRVAPP